MGFLGGGFFGSGAKQTTSSVATTYNTETNTQQTDQSGNSGLNFSSVEGGVSLQSTSNSVVNKLDGGAISRAFDLGSDALSYSGDVVKNALGFGSEALDGALGFGSEALDQVSRSNANSLELLGGLVSGAFDNSKTLTRDALDANAAAVKQAISGFSSLATQNSASSDDRLQKVVQYAVVAIAAAFIVPALFKGGKGAALV